MPRRQKPYGRKGRFGQITSPAQMVQRILSMQNQHLGGRGWGLPKVNTKKLLGIRKTEDKARLKTKPAISAQEWLKMN